MADRLHEFIAESNRIESIHRVTDDEVEAHEQLLALPELTVEAVERFVTDVAGAPLRDKPGMNVRVGNHLPPPGGPEIRAQLVGFLWGLSQPTNYTPYSAHVWYERVHPFIDGNGRSGRAIWAWYMVKLDFDPFALPFLHRFYYQALDASRQPTHNPRRADEMSETTKRVGMNVWVDVEFGLDCFVEFAVSPEGEVTFHGLDLPGMGQNTGAADAVGGTPSAGEAAERLRDIASRA
jgi:hypothetical protein